MTIEEKIKVARKKCKKNNRRLLTVDFSNLYPFTTENMNGYFDQFSWEKKSLLTVGSSGDQAINAIYKGCKDITVLDINPFTKEYFYLKKAAILSLSEEEYLKFLALKFPRKGEYYNKEVLQGFERIAPSLQEEDRDSYQFWEELLREFSPLVVRKRLFTLDEDSYIGTIKMNLYLKDSESYDRTRQEIKEVHPTFLLGDVRTTSLERSYDNILLSNLFDYLDERSGQRVIEKYISHLKENGKILFYYLYETTLYGEEVTLKDLYDPSRMISHLPSSEWVQFPGVRSLEDNSTVKDGAIIYQKKRR